MYFIALSSESKDIRSKCKNLAWLENIKLSYDKRQKRYEFRTTNAHGKKIFPIFEIFAKVHRYKIHSWIENNPTYKDSVYEVIRE